DDGHPAGRDPAPGCRRQLQPRLAGPRRGGQPGHHCTQRRQLLRPRQLGQRRRQAHPGPHGIDHRRQGRTGERQGTLHRLRPAQVGRAEHGPRVRVQGRRTGNPDADPRRRRSDRAAVSPAVSGAVAGAGKRSVARHMPAALAALLLAGAAATTLSAAEAGPSFDCTRAHTRVERAICATPRLAVLDGLLGRDYARSSEALPPGERACLAADQKAWLAQRDACDSDACLERAYLRRLQALQGLLPGMALDRRLDGSTASGAARLLAILPAGDATGIHEDEMPGVILEGGPLEDEGGYLLVDGAFDREAWHAYLDLQGDVEAIR